MSQKTTIWLDCDPGLDDTLAIIYAAHHPNINLIGVSTSPGNTTLANTTKNALNILHNIGRSDLDVFAGSFSQIQGVVKTAEIVHGENGLGGVSVKESPKKALTSNSFAEIYGLIMKQEGKVTWINTGSLTNLCLILMTFPDIKDKLAQIIMMGGAIERGNITPAAQFNIHCDPSAFDRVLKVKDQVPLVMIPLQTTHLFLADENIYNQFKKYVSFPFGHALYNMLVHYQQFYIQVNNWPYPPYHDPVCIYYLLHPQDFEVKKARIEVDSGKVSRGRTNCYFGEEEESNTFVTTGMGENLSKFWGEMLSAVKIVFSQQIQKQVK